MKKIFLYENLKVILNSAPIKTNFKAKFIYGSDLVPLCTSLKLKPNNIKVHICPEYVAPLMRHFKNSFIL